MSGTCNVFQGEPQAVHTVSPRERLREPQAERPQGRSCQLLVELTSGHCVTLLLDRGLRT